MVERFYYDYEDPEGHKILEAGKVLSKLETVGEFWKITDRLNELYNENEELIEENKKNKQNIQILFMDKQELENALARRERKIKGILQRHYDAKLGNDRIIETIAEDLGIELDLW